MEKRFFCKFLICLSASMLLTGIVFAEKKKYKWGKVDPSEFSERDTSNNASAIILFEIGTQDYAIVRGDFIRYFTKHVRIKILNKAGYDFANVKISYESRSGTEKIMEAEASSYWLNAKGEVESADLDKKLIFDENIDDVHRVRKFTIPSVKEGCIIEYRYKVSSEYIFHIKGWSFQHIVPTKYSELTNTIPEYFTFEKLMRGNVKIEEGETKNNSSITHIHSVNDAREVLGGGNRSEDYDIRMEMMENKFSAKDIPALEAEPYISSLDNYSTSIDFYLTGIHFPEGFRHEYSSSWKFLIDKLYDDEGFGKAFLNDNSVSDLAKSLTKGIDDKEKKLSAIYKYVNSSVSWNGVYEFYAGKKLRDVLDQHKGTSGEINLVLLQMLLACGIDAAPVLISTRENGIVKMAYPSLYQFNHVIISVNMEKGKIFLDATDPLRAPGLLDEEHLNGSGLLARKETQEWIKIFNKEKNRLMLSANCKLTSDGLMEVSYDKVDYGYDGYYERKRISAAASKTEYINKKLSSAISDVTILGQSFENFDSLDYQLKSHIKFTTHQFCNEMNNSFFIQPMINFALKENPLADKERKLPIEFASGSEETYYITITVPEGYSVKELPKSASVKMPGDAAAFSYITGTAENRIQLKCSISINSTYFDAASYEGLKEFFSKVLEKQNERVVLVKN